MNALRLMLLISAGGLAFQPHALNAQANICGELSDLQCALLTTAQTNWNEHFGHIAILDRFVYAERELSPGGIMGIYDESSDSPIVVSDEHGQYLDYAPIRDVLTASERHEEALNRIHRELESHTASVEHEVDIHWAGKDEFFITTAFVMNSYPFVIDTMLASVALESGRKECEASRVSWLTGHQRGEFRVRIIDFYDGHELRCVADVYSWMSLGQISYATEEVTYNTSRSDCWFRYAYRFATPVATVNINREDLRVEIRGIGSVVGGEGLCRAR